jgi:carboxypeptidase T
MLMKKLISLSIFFIAILMGSLVFSHGSELTLELEGNRKQQYKDIVGFIQKIQKENPNNTELFNLGTNDTGDVIQGIKIGSGPVNDLVVATHHGNEFASTEVAKEFAAQLAQTPIEGKTVYVVPVLNVSGYNARTRNEKGIDPNRDYPSPCKSGPNYRLKSTALLAQFLEEKNIVTSATLHTFSELILYPWGISTRDVDTRYTEFFKKLGFLATILSGYGVANSTEALYPADGTFEDYAYWKTGAWSLLFEMGKSHSPSADQVADTVKKNVGGLRNLFANSPTSRAEVHSFEGQCGYRGPRRTHLE